MFYVKNTRDKNLFVCVLVLKKFKFWYMIKNLPEGAKNNFPFSLLLRPLQNELIFFFFHANQHSLNLFRPCSTFCAFSISHCSVRECRALHPPYCRTLLFHIFTARSACPWDTPALTKSLTRIRAVLQPPKASFNVRFSCGGPTGS